MIEREPNVRTGVELFHSDEKMRIEAATYSIELAQHSPYMTLKDAEREQWALLSILSDVRGGGQDAAYELPAALSTRMTMNAMFRQVGRAYVRVQAKLGVPAYYYAMLIAGKKIKSQNKRALRNLGYKR